MFLSSFEQTWSPSLKEFGLNWPSGSKEDDENVKRQTDRKKDRTDGRRTNGDQKSSLELSAHGNNKAYKPVNSAFEVETEQFQISFTDLKHFFKLYINSRWQIFLDFCDTSKLYSIQNKANIPYNLNLKRSDQVFISRIRIGHSQLTHTYLSKGEYQPECIFCECPFTLYHILLECSDTSPWGTYYVTMWDLFTEANIFCRSVILQKNLKMFKL